MNHKYVAEQLDYHYWAQDRIFTQVEALTPEEFTRNVTSSYPSVRDTLVHIHFAECVWYARCQGEAIPALSAETFPGLESIRRASTEHEARMRAIVERLGQDGINAVLEYTSKLDGRGHRSRYWEMFQHVVNHGTYHRGQVTMMLRQLGAEPVATDLMLFYWEREESSSA